MSSPYLGEIRMFGGNYAPRNYAFCDGAILNVTQNSALFSLLGPTFGGNGSSTFGLPDLRGRAPLHHGTGPGLSPATRGQKIGVETVALTASQIPPHTHAAQGDTTGGAVDTPVAGAIWSSVPRGHPAPYASGAANAGMAATEAVGSNAAHNNRSPYQAIAFIIATTGIYPMRA